MTPYPTRTLTFTAARESAIDPSLEWLVTNGLGGYASGPVCGGITRRYHGWLVSALPAPIGRLVCVTSMRVQLRHGDRTITLDHEDLSVLAGADDGVLRSFTIEAGIPVWRYEAEGVVLERRIFMPHRRNVTCVQFRLLQHDRPVQLECLPWLQLRPHESAVSLADPPRAGVQIHGVRAEIDPGEGLPKIRIHAHSPGAVFRTFDVQSADIHYSEERARGYDHAGRLWSNCALQLPFNGNLEAAFTLSTDDWRSDASSTPAALHSSELTRRDQLLTQAGAWNDPFLAELVLAADQFLIVPVGHDPAGANPDVPPPPGAASRTIIAGYHWFTDWGRDTMISLEGLTLDLGRHDDAAQILRLFARHVEDGLIPNLFPEGARSGLYHTADATLWFVHAVGRYTARSGDTSLVNDLLPVFVDIISAHRRGTRFGIGVDPADGLLRQGEEGYQLTWMDAKVDGWVVTPRRGKAVEINALWYNALRLVAGWLDAAGRGQEARACEGDAERVRASFNRRFWNPDTGWLFDVIDGPAGDDDACRPNQLFAVSLPHPVLDETRWQAIVDVVDATLLTPLGLRSLAPGHVHYQSQYTGDLRSRDASYHQGTVWAWLIGAYVDARLKLPGVDHESLRDQLRSFAPHLSAAGVGSISEIFDADMPHLPRGCIAQAWSVAEVLRCWRKVSAR